MNKTIIVVDDDRGILDAMQFVLENEGYTLLTTEKGEVVENLEQSGVLLPDLIILDVLISGKDGRVICKQLKSREKTKHIPVLMISAHPDADISSRASGADDFLAKPFDVDVLLEKVRNCL